MRNVIKFRACGLALVLLVSFLPLAVYGDWMAGTTWGMSAQDAALLCPDGRVLEALDWRPEHLLVSHYACSLTMNGVPMSTHFLFNERGGLRGIVMSVLPPGIPPLAAVVALSRLRDLDSMLRLSYGKPVSAFANGCPKSTPYRGNECIEMWLVGADRGASLHDCMTRQNTRGSIVGLRSVGVGIQSPWEDAPPQRTRDGWMGLLAEVIVFQTSCLEFAKTWTQQHKNGGSDDNNNWRRRDSMLQLGSTNSILPTSHLLVDSTSFNFSPEHGVSIDGSTHDEYQEEVVC